VLLATIFLYLLTIYLLMADLAWWWEYSPTTQELAGSIPAQCKNLCA
jgi:hypothetical protein